MKNDTIKVGAGVLIIKDGKVLMTKRRGALGHGEFGTVGGHVEYGEHPIDTVKREAREELGIEIGNIKFLDCASVIKYGKHYIDLSFTADIISGEPKVLEPERIEGVGFYPLDDLPEPIFEYAKLTLEAYKSRKNYFETQD
ncbi:MAG: NUDIX domain-containing protein [Candidatus Doudnabacteria bacterium]|nr:NUDIX domain-containing protein [Candidatus Doudnabacteria bacterium]